MGRYDDAMSHVLVVGVDEAGYGPNLGPMVVAATAFLVPRDLAESDWWSALAGTVGRAGDSKSKLQVDDSKAFGTEAGWNRLVDAVLAFQLASTSEPKVEYPPDPRRDPAAWLRHVTAPELTTGEPWFDSALVPRSTVAKFALEPDKPLGTALANARIEPIAVVVEPVFARRFNEGLDRGLNKGEVEQEAVLRAIGRLFAGLGREVADRTSQVRLFVDRLGGRKSYREFVEELSDGSFPVTLDESADVSRYAGRFAAESATAVRGREFEISFEVGGDAIRLPIALASMNAKLTREAAMDLFNAWWAERLPGIRPTAGYPEDAKRFRRDAADALRALDLPQDGWWRRK
jgi:ribonuclease HII